MTTALVTLAVGSKRSRWMPARDRLLSQVEVDASGCWMWTGRTSEDGYGCTGYKGNRNEGAHRAVYDLLVGPIPNGQTLDHLCHTRDESCPGGRSCPHRRCVNPAHLEPVERLVNILRGRSFVAVNARKERCICGAEYTPGLYGRKRACRPCAIRRARECKQRRNDRARAVAA